MAGGIDWFRWHHGSVTDPKFQLVARKAGVSVPDVLAVWAFVLEQASTAEERGIIGALDAEAIDCLFGFDDGATASILAHMAGRGLIADGVVCAWERRQPKRERPDEIGGSTERMRAHRAAKASQPPAAQVTPSDATGAQVTPSDAMRRPEESREEEKEQEQKTTAAIASAVSASPKRAVRKCPADFEVTAELQEFAASHPGVDWQAETAKFRDHTFKTAISEWGGAWRNWIRRTAEKAQQARASPALSFRERDDLAAAERVRECSGGNVAAKPITRRNDALQKVFDVTPRYVGQVAVRPVAGPVRVDVDRAVEGA